MILSRVVRLPLCYLGCVDGFDARVYTDMGMYIETGINIELEAYVVVVCTTSIACTVIHIGMTASITFQSVLQV